MKLETGCLEKGRVPGTGSRVTERGRESWLRLTRRTVRSGVKAFVQGKSSVQGGCGGGSGASERSGTSAKCAQTCPCCSRGRRVGASPGNLCPPLPVGRAHRSPWTGANCTLAVPSQRPRWGRRALCCRQDAGNGVASGGRVERRSLRKLSGAFRSPDPVLRALEISYF